MLDIVGAIKSALVDMIVGVQQHLSQGDEHLTQRGMGFHIGDAIDIFLCRGYMVVLVPKLLGRIGVVLKIGEISDKKQGYNINNTLFLKPGHLYLF